MQDIEDMGIIQDAYSGGVFYVDSNCISTHDQLVEKTGIRMRGLFDTDKPIKGWLLTPDINGKINLPGGDTCRNNIAELPTGRYCFWCFVTTRRDEHFATFLNIEDKRLYMVGLDDLRSFQEVIDLQYENLLTGGSYIIRLTEAIGPEGLLRPHIYIAIVTYDKARSITLKFARLKVADSSHNPKLRDIYGGYKVYRIVTRDDLQLLRGRVIHTEKYREYVDKAIDEAKGPLTKKECERQVIEGIALFLNEYRRFLMSMLIGQDIPEVVFDITLGSIPRDLLSIIQFMRDREKGIRVRCNLIPGR